MPDNTPSPESSQLPTLQDRRIRIVPHLKGHKEGVICFETGCSRDEVCDLHHFVFDHHGSEHHPLFSPSALRLFHERLMLGQAMPSVLLLTRWYRIDQIMASAMFIEPGLLLLQGFTSLVQSVDQVERLGPLALAHIPWEHKELIRLLRHVTRLYRSRQAHQESLSTQDHENALTLLVQCTQYIATYLMEGTLPLEPETPPELDVLAAGEGFIAFTCEEWPWDVAWSSGAVWGVWFGPRQTEVRAKSTLIGLETRVVTERLGEMFTYQDDISPGWVSSSVFEDREAQEELLERLLGS